MIAVVVSFSGGRTQGWRFPGEISKGGARGGGMLGQLHHANGTHKTPQALANPTSDNPASTLIMTGNRQTGNKKKDE